MKVIYHDYSGRHLAVVAAALHLQIIDEHVSRRDLQQLPNFMHTKPPGTLLYMGLDSQGNEVYVLGRQKSFGIIRNAYLGLNRAFQLNQDIVFADLQPIFNWRLKLFDFLNRKGHEAWRCSKLLYKGLDGTMPKIIRVIQEVRKKTAKKGESG